MSRIFSRALAAAMVLMLAACVSTGQLVPARSGIPVFDLQLDSQLDWSRTKLPREEIWTIDGVFLNRFLVYSGVKPGEHVFLAGHERSRRPDGPWFRPGMRPDEIRDVILDALRGSGWSNVSASNLRPARFGDVDGLRFEAAMTLSNGLLYKGMFGAVERKGKLVHFLWIAPAEYYYDRDAAAVEKMFESMRFVK